MFRVLSILAAVAALAVSAAPASANVNNIDLWVGAKSGVLDTGMFDHQWLRAHAERAAITDGTSNTLMVAAVVTEKMSATH
jgi:non-canonical (house-cleaning) NTP pyrophosphatase